MGKPLVIEQVPIPEPTGRQILVKVKAASLCHSDLSIIDGGFGPLPVPLIVGHEAVSVVEKLGPDAAAYGIKVGDVIGTPLWQDMCLQCADCRTAGPQFCPTMQIMGMNTAGYFAEYALVDPATAVVIPPARAERPSALAPVFCAGITVWDALERADLKPGQTVAVVGAGGLGQTAVQYAHGLGANVIALDIRDEQLLACKADNTADEIVNTTGLDPAALVARTKEVNNGRLVDTAIVCSGTVPAYNTALAIVKAEGSVVAVGLPHQPIPVHAAMVSVKAIKYVHTPNSRSWVPTTRELLLIFLHLQDSSAQRFRARWAHRGASTSC